MFKKLRYSIIFVLLSMPLVSCVIYRIPDTVVPEPTPTPLPRVKSIALLETQPGDTNFIILVGILIFLFIVIPILLHYKDWRAS